jgi:hypothetical protein
MHEAVILMAIAAAVLIATYLEKFQRLVIAIIAGTISQHLGSFLASQPVKDLLNEFVNLVWGAVVALACSLCMLAGCTSCEIPIWTFPF